MLNKVYIRHDLTQTMASESQWGHLYYINEVLMSHAYSARLHISRRFQLFMAKRIATSEQPLTVYSTAYIQSATYILNKVSKAFDHHNPTNN